MIRLVLPAAFVLLAATLGAQTGLIDQPQTFPWSVGLAPSALQEAGGLESGTWRLRTSVLWFNTYRALYHDKTFTTLDQQVDMEGAVSTTTVDWSPADHWEFRAQVQAWAVGGGVMDLFLAGFHGALSVPNQGRDLVSDNQYRNLLEGWFDDTSPSAGLTQASLGVRWFDGDFSWTAWIKPPLAPHPGWGWVDRWAAGIGPGWGLRAAWPWDWPLPGLLAAGGLSASLVAAEPDPRWPGGLGPLTAQAAGYAAVELNDGPRLLVEGTWTRVPRAGIGYLAQGAGLLTVGLQGRAGDLAWEVALVEEFLTWATLEVGFQTGLVWTL